MIPGPNYRLTNREIVLIERTAYTLIALSVVGYAVAFCVMFG